MRAMNLPFPGHPPEALGPGPERPDPPLAPGGVVFLPCRAHRDPRSHESVTQTAHARTLAGLLGLEFAGSFDPARPREGPVYFVPSHTLAPLEAARRLGIRGEQDLFGGVVPHPFVAGKTITHGLPDAGARAPEGWSPAFARRVEPVVLPGCSAFSPRDAELAGRRLLAQGAVRLKLASGIGGSGQWVVDDARALLQRIAALDPEELGREGLVLERNLKRVATFSVGQVRVGPWVASYHGTQHATRNNRGEEVYGGSRLRVVRGDFDALLRHTPAAPLRLAVEQARRYHEAARACFPGWFASRCNYDVAQGIDDAGRWHSGVLEQSWRIGGASGAELAALQAFAADPALERVCASTVEVYGPDPAIPADAQVCFSGEDPHVGPITKYTRLETHGHAG